MDTQEPTQNPMNTHVEPYVSFPTGQGFQGMIDRMAETFGLTNNEDTKYILHVEGPLKGSKTYNLYNYAFKKLGIDISFIPFPINEEDLEACLDASMENERVIGFHPGAPFKGEVIPYVQSSNLPKELGVCAMRKQGGNWVGAQVDGLAWKEWYDKTQGGVRNLDLLIIGAGASGTSIGYAVAGEDYNHLTITDIIQEKGEKLKSLPRCEFKLAESEGSYDAIRKADLIVNASGVGKEGKTEGQNPLSRPDLISRNAILMDLNYRPRKTAFLEQGEPYAKTIINGLDYLCMENAHILGFYLSDSGVKHGTDAAYKLLNDYVHKEFKQYMIKESRHG